MPGTTWWAIQAGDGRPPVAIQARERGVLRGPSVGHPERGRDARSLISRTHLISTTLILSVVLMDALRWLRESGVVAELVELPPRPGDVPPDAALEVAAGDATARFAVAEKRRAPYPNELVRLAEGRQALAVQGHPLLITPFVSEALGPVLTAADWSWADAQGNFDLRAPGLTLRQRRTAAAPKAKSKNLPQGSGSLAIIRALIGFSDGEDEELRATTLAAQAKVSQPRASQVLRQLHELGLVERSGSGRWEPDRVALLDRLLADYRGPGGTERYFYSLDSPTDVAIRAAGASARERPIVVSADVGPDLLLAWRRPSVVILYATNEIVPGDPGLVEAQGRHDANVIVRYPDDRSVFPVPNLIAELQGVEIPLAAPSQLIWDLQDLGGADRLEAAGMLREWLLTSP